MSARFVASTLAALLSLVPVVAGAQDRDFDGVADASDLCPDAREVDALLLPGDGCPDLDADADRIVDDVDVCPAAAETHNAFEDADGCPDLDGATVHELAERVLFPTGEHSLPPSAAPVVQRLAAFLLAHGEIARVEIDGHADARGDDDANLVLSQRRADALRDALVAAGVPSAQIRSVGRGALAGHSPAIRAENRRCDVRTFVGASSAVPAPDLSRGVGRWRADAAHFVLDVQAAVADSHLRVEPGAPEWLGPVGSVFDCYAGRASEDHFVLHCRGVDREATLLARIVDADHLAGFLEVRAHGAIDRAPWSATRSATFDQNAVVRMVAAHRRELYDCYEAALAHAPTLAGRIAILMAIDAGGTTRSVRVAESSMEGGEAVGACLVGVIAAFHFDPAPIGAPVTYTFPIVFDPPSAAPADTRSP